MWNARLAGCAVARQLYDDTYMHIHVHYVYYTVHIHSTGVTSIKRVDPEFIDYSDV